MLSLLRIRVKYLIRKPCLLFWSYLFLPILVLIIAIYQLIHKSTQFDVILKENPIEIGEKYFFSDANSYDDIKYYFYFSMIVVDDKKYCDQIIGFFKKNKIFRNINCSTTIKDATNLTANIIQIEKKKNKFRINLSLRNVGMIPFNFFAKEDLDQDKITDVFYMSMDHNNETKHTKFIIFWELQSLLSKLLIELNGKKIGPNFKMKFGYNPYPEHYPFSNEYDSFVCSFLTFIISLQFSILAYNFNLRMIDEKENKLYILLERQGISKFKYHASWLITFYVLSLISIIAVLLLIFSDIIFHYLLAIINMILFTFDIFCVCIFFTTCIKTTKTGTTAIKFYNFGSLLLGFVIVLPKTIKAAKIIFCFIPQINLFLNIYTTYSLNNFKNITWDRLWLKAANMSYMETIIMYIVQIIFYLGLSIIIQSYKASGLDFISYVKSFCTKVSRKVNSSNINNEIDNIKVHFEIHHQELSEENQRKKNQNQYLQLINVTKNFEDLKAVDNFNGELFPNEIFCLLGHNGAGKSTTINMISGLFDPDEGDILLNGKSLVTNKDYLYENIGLCQQEDIFFDYLTVEEHLKYMCKIKGSKINENEIKELINKIDLSQKKDALCSTLSGGQKRKLCIALALIGDSKIILLDEPTSGMDVMARRSLWEFLKNYKKDKIILLTTHFLDEAEYLGDRIGIMSDGKYLCSGTSSFLKSKYPCGFNINLLINSSIFNEDYKQQIFADIQKYEPKAEIKVASKSILSINIQSNNKKIPQIFDYIEKNKVEYGIEDYTVCSTSLEDVFLKIHNKGALNGMKYLNKNENSNNIEQIDYNIPVSSGFCSQLKAQIVRGLYPLYRNKTLFFFELLSGLGFMYLFIGFFSDLILDSTTQRLNLITVLNRHDIYFYEKNTNQKFLKTSDIYNNLGKSISFRQIEEEPNNIEHFMNIVYDKSFANIAKGALYIDGTNENLYEVYNTEVDNGLNGYLYANTMIFISSFLKKCYDIDATIFNDMEFHSIGGDEESIFKIVADYIVLLIVSLISLFGYVIFLGGLMFEKIKERRTNIKNLLYLSGSNIWSYWIGFYIVDYLKLLIFNIFLIFPIYFISGAATYFGLDMLLISLSSLSFIYFITFFCSKDDEGAKVLFLIVFGFILIVSLIALVWGDKLKVHFRSFTKLYVPNIFDLTPMTSMGLSFFRIIISYSLYNVIEEISNETGIKIESNIIELGRPSQFLYTSYIAQGLNFIFYTLLLMFAETGTLGKLIHWMEVKLYGKKNNYEFGKEEVTEDFNNNNNSYNNINIQNDNINNTYMNFINNKQRPGSVSVPLNSNDDGYIQTSSPSSRNPLVNPYVQKEIEKINSGKNLTTKITGLIKTFYGCCGCKNVRAINNLYLGLEPNEKFGLLGFNGSGKTTTFRAITNEILTDAGSITLFGYNTKTHFEKIRTIIGYCPQINPLFDFMKVKEIIKFYSELKTCNEKVESVCAKFGLSKYSDTYTVNLSGGNKRKLTFAIAMMNRPRLLLLDEPSTGVDPESRRIMWRNINELSNTGHEYNMILTTHSMEEAEVLCDTVSWLKAGNFITIGNPEELKIHYSAGYKLHIKFDDNIINNNNNSNDINKVYNNSLKLFDGINQYLEYINSNPLFEPYLRKLNSIMEKIKDKTDSISLNLIGKDFSFDLVIKIKKEKQKELFSEILNMKNIDKQITEMNIAMQSLENILTSLN